MEQQKEQFVVKYSTGTARAMTLSNVDREFEAGHIDFNSPVLAPDGDNWSTLGALAGVEAEAEQQPPSIAPVAFTDTEVAVLPKKRSRVLVAFAGLATLAVIGAAGTWAVRSGKIASTKTAASPPPVVVVAAAPPPVVAAPLPPPPAPAPVVAAPKPVSLSSLASTDSAKAPGSKKKPAPKHK